MRLGTLARRGALVATLAVTASVLAPAPSAVRTVYGGDQDALFLSPSNEAVGQVSHVAGNAHATYALSHNAVDGSVVRWNPCGAIRWQFNPRNAPSYGLADAKEAIRRLSLVSGLHFFYAGTTTTMPTSTFGPRPDGTWPPLTIAFALPGHGTGHSDLIGAVKGQVGMGGYRTIGTSTDDEHWSMHIATGFAVIAANAHLRHGFGVQPTLGAVLMHELGHAVGLSHAADSGEIMYPSVQVGRTSSWGLGDRVALGFVGKNAGCVTAG